MRASIFLLALLNLYEPEALGDFFQNPHTLNWNYTQNKQ